MLTRKHRLEKLLQKSAAYRKELPEYHLLLALAIKRESLCFAPLFMAYRVLTLNSGNSGTIKLIQKFPVEIATTFLYAFEFTSVGNRIYGVEIINHLQRRENDLEFYLGLREQTVTLQHRYCFNNLALLKIENGMWKHALAAALPKTVQFSSVFRKVSYI